MEPPSSTSHPRARRIARWLAGVLVLAAGGAALCQRLLVTVYVVDGVSMEPTLQPGQRLVVWRPCGALARGDLVVFRNPVEPDEVMVKRVLGLPREEVEVAHERLFVGASRSGALPPARRPHGQRRAGDRVRGPLLPAGRQPVRVDRLAPVRADSQAPGRGQGDLARLSVSPRGG